MARYRKSWFDDLQRRNDEALAAAGNDDARIRVAKRRIADRLERQAEQPVVVPATGSAIPETPPKRKRKRSPEEHTAALPTMVAAVSLAAYMDSGEPFDERMSDSRLADDVAVFAAKVGIEGAELLKPDGSVMREIMKRAKPAIRLARAYRAREAKTRR
jgi:hypothetical protein